MTARRKPKLLKDDVELPLIIEELGLSLCREWNGAGRAWLAVITFLLRISALRLAEPDKSVSWLLSRYRTFLTASGEIELSEPERFAFLDAFFETSSIFIDSEPLKLSRLYETILNMVPVLEEGKLKAHRRSQSRKRSGSFYSPPHLVDATVESALSALDLSEPMSLKIVDPAMGAGVFLLAAYRYLKSHCAVSSLSSQAIGQCLYGVDLDPLAVEVGRLSLWLEVGDWSIEPAQAFPNFRVGNSLIGCRIDHAFSEPRVPRLKSRTARAFANPQKDWTERAISSLALAEQERRNLRVRMDAWCAAWFQDDYLEVDCSAIAMEHKFFHWELEFPEVFDRQRPGFDAVVGNPPWEIEKPNSREFFGAVDASYWELGKQQALAAQKRMLAQDKNLARAWEARKQSHNYLSRWMRNAPVQFSSQSAHPLRCQGTGDLNLYKLFSEQAFYLTRAGGVTAMIVPSGIYADSGSRELRRLFFTEGQWLRVVSFENRDAAFDIHRSFKFCIFVVRKGGTTERIAATFFGTDCDIDVESLSLLSPRWSVIPELDGPQPLKVLHSVYRNSDLLGDIEYGGSPLLYAREFDMTLDSDSFVESDVLHKRGYRQDCYGNWLLGDWRESSHLLPDIASGVIGSACGHFSIAVDRIKDVFLPLYEGRMIGQFSCNEKCWLGGKGRRADWGAPKDPACLGPQYLVNRYACSGRSKLDQLKLGFLAVGCATNARTMIAAPLSGVPCGNSVPVFSLPRGSSDALTADEFLLALLGCMNSLVFDYVIRRKMSGNNLNYFVVEECPVPRFNADNLEVVKLLASLVGQISLTHLRFCRNLLALGFSSLPRPTVEARRETRALIDVIVCRLYGVSQQELKLILLSTGGERDRKGFHRVDRDLPVDQRLPNRVLSLSSRLPDERDVLPLGRSLLTGEGGSDLSAHAAVLANILS